MDTDTLLDVLLRSFVILITLFILAKIMGKKQVSQLNLYDYIIGITLGSLGADVCLDTEKPLIDGILALSLFALSAALISYLTIKSIFLRRIFMGVPTVLIENGNIIEKGLKKVKFDVNDLLEEARNANYFNLEEIEYALMESTGKISFLPKDEYKPVTKKDMGLKIKKEVLTANLIIDEKVLLNNLKSIKKDEKWLKHELKVQGYNNYEGILLATLDSNDKLKIYKKDVNCQYGTVLE